MEKADIIELVRDYLGFHKALSEAIILRHMDVFQQEVERPHGRLPLPWFLFNGTYELYTKQGVGYIDLPNTFIQQDDRDEWQPYLSTDYKRSFLLPTLSQTIAWKAPTQYEVIGDRRLYLAPTPDDVYLIIFPHYAKSPKLSTADTNVWFEYFPIYTAVRTAISIAGVSRDEEALASLSVLFRREEDNYATTVEGWRHQMREYIYGPR